MCYRPERQPSGVVMSASIVCGVLVFWLAALGLSGLWQTAAWAGRAAARLGL